MLRWALYLAAPLWAASPAAAAPSVPSAEIAPSHPERRIQIGIKPHADEVSMVPEGRYSVVDAEGKRQELRPRMRVRLEPLERGLRLGPFTLGKESVIRPHAAEDSMEIDGKRYGGTLLVRLDESGETVTVVEELGIESYLLGVLPYEMEPDWPLEALKAQAVVARTFAYTQLGKYRKEGFDLSTDTRSQVYGGRSKESASVRRAVERTRGEVLGYHGKIMDVYYHACCGGHTARAGGVWGGDSLPPLAGVKDKYCHESPIRNWRAVVSYDELLGAIQKRRMIGGALTLFEIGRRDLAGYVRTFIATVGGETLTVRASDLRSSLGGQLRSTRIQRVGKLRRGVEFRGTGLGHGVGLCQWGARLQADRGRGYERILQFYFPGATLSVIDE